MLWNRKKQFLLLIIGLLLIQIQLPQRIVQCINIEQKEVQQQSQRIQQMTQTDIKISVKSDQKFIGDLLWGTFDLVTLGIYEKRYKNQTKKEYENLQKKHYRLQQDLDDEKSKQEQIQMDTKKQKEDLEQKIKEESEQEKQQIIDFYSKQLEEKNKKKSINIVHDSSSQQKIPQKNYQSVNKSYQVIKNQSLQKENYTIPPTTNVTITILSEQRNMLMRNPVIKNNIINMNDNINKNLIEQYNSQNSVDPLLTDYKNINFSNLKPAQTQKTVKQEEITPILPLKELKIQPIKFEDSQISPVVIAKKQEVIKPPCKNQPIKSNGLILDNFGFNISRIPSESESKALNLSKQAAKEEIQNIQSIPQIDLFNQSIFQNTNQSQELSQDKKSDTYDKSFDQIQQDIPIELQQTGGLSLLLQQKMDQGSKILATKIYKKKQDQKKSSMNNDLQEIQERNFDQLMEKLTKQMKKSQDQTQKARTDEIFHKYSIQTDQDGLERKISKKNSFQALVDLVESWNIEIDEDQEKKLKKQHFNPTFKKFNHNSQMLNQKKAVEFVNHVFQLNKDEIDRLKEFKRQENEKTF